MSLNSIRTVLCLTKGDDQVFSMRLTNDAGLPVDVTGSTLLLDFKNDTRDRTATITDAVNGEFEFRYDSVDTEQMTPGTVYGVFARIIGGERTSLLRVTLRVEDI